MSFHIETWRLASHAIPLFLLAATLAQAQEQSTAVTKIAAPKTIAELKRTETTAPHASRSIDPYFDPAQGASSNEIVRRALAANGELVAVRLEIERARARLRQAGLRPNPSLDFEQTTGRFTGSPGETEFSMGIAVPIERRKRSCGVSGRREGCRPGVRR